MTLFAESTQMDDAVPGAGSIPRVVRTPYGSQFLVDGAPFLSLGGELHNSSPSSPAYMAPIWDRLAEKGIRSIVGAASWQLVEPEEGTFDFTAVDDQVAQARARGIRLVLIWFGSYKNAESSYAPGWVRRDQKRFPGQSETRSGSSSASSRWTARSSASSARTSSRPMLTRSRSSCDTSSRSTRTTP
jgi:beta-galactosidase GanA